MGRATLTLGNSPSVLLASASSGGTTAPARDLAATGFEVRVVSSHRFEAAAWSRHAARVYQAPPQSGSQRLLERLLEIGKADPGRILLPTSDETAWLYTDEATELGRYFRMFQPPIAVLLKVLDKELFTDAAISAGLAVLPNWNPRNIDDLAVLAP